MRNATMSLVARAFLALLMLVVFGPVLLGVARAEETSEQKLVLAVDRIWDRAGHSAFTDLVEFNGHLYCVFREATGHIPGMNGVIRVLRSADRMNWESVALLEERHVDLRDPKICITPDGRLMLNIGASYYHGNERKSIESRVAFSNENGEEFSAPQKVVFPSEVLTEFDWLWRTTWHGDTAWACLQQVPDRNRRSLLLVRSSDGIHYEVVVQLPVEGANETTLRFTDDDTMLAMIRCETGEARGHIGLSKPPYTDWQIRATNKRFGGPNLVQLANGAWLAGSRGYETSPTTQVWQLDLDQAEFRELVTLPSGGDTSYPGLVVDEPNNRVYMSYYASHEGKSAIYLATLRLDALIEATGDTASKAQ